jgi:hypothetical protein
MFKTTFFFFIVFLFISGCSEDEKDKISSRQYGLENILKLRDSTTRNNFYNRIGSFINVVEQTGVPKDVINSLRENRYNIQDFHCVDTISYLVKIDITPSKLNGFNKNYQSLIVLINLEGEAKCPPLYFAQKQFEIELNPVSVVTLDLYTVYITEHTQGSYREYVKLYVLRTRNNSLKIVFDKIIREESQTQRFYSFDNFEEMTGKLFLIKVDELTHTETFEKYKLTEKGYVQYN